MEYLKEVLVSCLEQTSLQDLIEQAVGHFRKRLAWGTAASGGHVERCFD